MLYNIKKSFAIHHINVDKYKIYFEEYGSPDGIPILFLHGGPGSGCAESHKAIFNYKKFRVIFLDQRGAGKSAPKGSTYKNTTQHLIDDIERVRNYLNISAWLIVGGSWGATLAVAYSEIHYDRVYGIIVRSLFLATKKELEWAFFDAALKFRPKLISDINKALNLKTLQNPIPALGKMLDSQSSKKKCLAAELWLEYEGNLSTLESKENRIESILRNKDYSDRRLKNLPNTPFIEWHYIKNNFFLKKNQLLKNKVKIKELPIFIIQSDYDLLCPPSTSYFFIEGLNKAKVYKVGKAGHYISDPGIKEKMKEVIDSFTK